MSAGLLNVSEALSQAAHTKKGKFKTTDVQRAVAPEIDLGTLLCCDPSPVDLPSAPTQRDTKLALLARDTVQVLVNNIWGLDTERDDVHGVIAKLPAPTTIIPREKPIPVQKAQTKWEKFAAEKGIQKRKRSRMEFDDETQEYKPRYGFGSKGNTEPWIIEVPNNVDPNTDMFEQRRKDKEERLSKNEKQRLRNLGVPKLAKPMDHENASTSREQKKINLDAQLQVSKQSTASMGRFDEKLRGEPKSQVKHREKRQFMPNEAVAEEKGRNKNILARLLDSAQGSLDVKKGAAREANKMRYEEGQARQGTQQGNKRRKK